MVEMVQDVRAGQETHGSSDLRVLQRGWLLMMELYYSHLYLNWLRVDQRYRMESQNSMMQAYRLDYRISQMEFEPHCDYLLHKWHLYLTTCTRHHRHQHELLHDHYYQHQTNLYIYALHNQIQH
jgi:hypothetical protein